MVVPVRSDEIDLSSTGTSFNFEYDFEDWVSDGGVIDPSYQPGAYYATSTYIVVKSSSQITIPIVTD